MTDELSELKKRVRDVLWNKIPDRLPPINLLVGLIDMRQFQNDPGGDYPAARIGHLAEFGTTYWSCYGERAVSIDSFTHWCALPEFPWEEKP